MPDVTAPPVKPAIAVRSARKLYRRDAAGVAALDGVSFEIPPGVWAAITGPSGCGKSTLLNLLGGLDSPDSGEVWVAGIPLHNASDDALTGFRRTRLGMVFQFFNLMPGMTVLENAALPLTLAGIPRAECEARAREQLGLVGMRAREAHFPHQLSGGEMQRAAIARALVHRPEIVLADEPTGNLDSANAAQVLEIFAEIRARRLATLVVVTHSEEVASRADLVLPMRDGRLAWEP